MKREADAGAPDHPTQPPGRIRVLGVDPADPRTLPELTRQLPADGTTVHRVPALADWARAERVPRRNPPGAFLAALGRLRGVPIDGASFTSLLDAAVGDLPVSFEEIVPAADEPTLRRAHWWSIATWTGTVLAIAVPIAGTAAALLSGGVITAIFAGLVTVAAIALFVGVGLARQAAAIRRHDAAAADLIATGVAGDGAKHVVVVPARNAAGVAVALRERGIDAEARRIPSEDGQESLS